MGIETQNFELSISSKTSLSNILLGILVAKTLVLYEIWSER